MKNFIIVLMFFLSTKSIAQFVELKSVKDTDEIQIENQLNKIQNEFNKQFKKDVKEGKEPNFIKFKIKDIQINEKNALVDCEILYSDKTESKLLKKQILKFGKNKIWELKDYPQILEESINKIGNWGNTKEFIQKKSPTNLSSTASIQEVNIQLSNDVFIPYPVLNHPSVGDVFEIDYSFTNENLDRQLFAYGSDVDGCVYYRSYNSENNCDRVIFYVDPLWNRILFSREVNGEFYDIKGYSGDINVNLKKPIAIDVNENGELFVLDQSKAVFKLQYNANTHTITSTTSSKIIDSQYLRLPSDICYSNRGTYSNLNDDLIVISDLEKKSIMIFNHNGILLKENNAYSGIPMTGPKSVEVTEDLNYPKIYFVDGQTVVCGVIYNQSDYHINGSSSSSFSNNSDLKGLGIFSVLGEVDGIIVTDAALNMLHLFDPISAKYICSYKGEGNNYFTAPLQVYSTAYADYNLSNNVRFDFFTMDMWSSTRGLKRFVAGADIFNIEVTRGYFNYLLTFDEAFVAETQIDLYRSIGTNVWVLQEEDGPPIAYDWLMADNYTYKWVIKYKPYNNDLYQGYGVDWKSKEIIFTTHSIFPSVIDEDIMISGDYEVNSNVTINQGATLTIVGEGGTLTFNNNSRLMVYGGLTITGYPSPSQSSNHILNFINKNGGIYCYGGSNVNINGAIIKNASYGIYASHVSPTIKNTNISNCTYGIYAYYSSPYIEKNIITSSNYGIYLYNNNNTTGYGNTKIINNDLSNMQSHGISVYNSIAKIRGNKISNCSSCGIYSQYSCSLYLGEAGYLGNNRIESCTYGLHNYNNSYMFLGREGCTLQGGNNIVINNSYKNAYTNTNGSIIQAEKTWWGSAPPPTSKFFIGSGCNLYYIPYLTGIPSQSISNLSLSPEETLYNNIQSKLIVDNTFSATLDKKYNYDHKWPLDWKIQYVRNLVMVEDYKFAKKICEEIIDNYPDSSQAFPALNFLLQSTDSEDLQSTIDYLTKKIKDNKETDIYGLMEIFLADSDRNKKNKSSEFDRISKKYKNKKTEEISLFHNFVFNFVDEENVDEARKIAKELDKLDKNSVSAIEANRMLGNVVDNYKIFAKNPEDQNIEKTSTKYELFGNYPNPFNPSTTIKYSIPFVSYVNLSIYDVTGSMIKSFEVNSQSAGNHEIVWDATNSNGEKVSSGIYLYRLKLVSQEGSGKVFEKTAKLLLIK